MKLFIDTADVDDIRRACEMGCVSGVTTNPTLVAKEGRDFHEVIREISGLVDGPVNAEVLSDEAEGMVAEAQELVRLGRHVVVKVPMTAEGLKASSRLERMGIPTNVTLVFSPGQALLAARAGASYVSLFVGRIDDTGWNGVDLVRTTADIFDRHGVKTKIIAASIRRAGHIAECALAGADIATVPFNVLMDALRHPLTDVGLARFKADWEAAQQKQ